jgi:CBS domain containing-hemolysin-like protein
MLPLFAWLGIFFCLSQSAILSGMNLGLFSISRLELQVEAKKGNRSAKKILHLREDANFALVTILWGNVGVNVLIALLSGSVLTGVSAFIFSTVIITIFAEIIPQSYFTRNSLRLAYLLSPVLRLYQFLLFPLAKPTALILDKWLGGEEIRYFKERDLRQVIEFHMEAEESDIAFVEGQGALNFLELEDVSISEEGEIVDPESIVQILFDGNRPVFPALDGTAKDSFLYEINKSGKSWVVLSDQKGDPRLVLRADDFIREALFNPDRFNPYRHCHRPIIVRDEKKKLGELIQQFRVRPTHAEDDILDYDVILLWNEQKRLVTGTDILGRLLRGIVKKTG